jgi:hypothetical protein
LAAYAAVSSSPSNYDLEAILAQLVDPNGICRICGHDHSITQPNTEDLKIRMDDTMLEAD